MPNASIKYVLQILLSQFPTYKCPHVWCLRINIDLFYILLLHGFYFAWEFAKYSMLDWCGEVKFISYHKFSNICVFNVI